jgi:fructokinase
VLPKCSLPPEKAGAPSGAYYKIGTDVLGSRLVALLHGNGISTEFVQVDDKHATGKVYAQVGEGDEVAYEIASPAAWDFISWEDKFRDLLMQADFFVYGSLSTRSPGSRDTL